MQRDSRSFGAILKHPSAMLPLLLSTAALALLLGSMAYGVAIGKPLVHEADEGALAHIWQLLMGIQLPVLAFFAIKWLPQAPKQVCRILALQAGAALAAMAPVYFLHL